MSTISQVQQNIAEGEALKSLAQAYTEISSVRLNRIRSQIEQNTHFALELANLMFLVKQEAAKRRIISADKKTAIINLLITSNYRFYGSLERSLIHYFLAGTDKLESRYPHQPCIRIVIGKSGITYLQGLNYRKPYIPIVFKKDIPTEKELKDLLSQIKNYQTILAYHTRFKSVLYQIPVVTDITKTVLNPPQKVISSPYLFEPEIEKIIDFFDTQIMEILLQQTILESELARTAARLISMNQAQQNAHLYIKNQLQALALANRTILNNSILETAAAYSHWRKHNEQ